MTKKTMKQLLELIDEYGDSYTDVVDADKMKEVFFFSFFSSP